MNGEIREMVVFLFPLIISLNVLKASYLCHVPFRNT